FNYSIEEVAPLIDWSYFLHAWGIAGKKESTQAKEVIADAKAMLHELSGRYRTNAIFALCNAKGDGDNIIIEGSTLPLLRQQHSTDGKYNLCLSDFVSPHGDKIGLFATSVESEFGKEYAGDEYKNLLAQTLADRLAEATATLLHKRVRTDNTLWGYAPDEELTLKDLLAERNQGIRPAVGYPSLPDQSIIFTIDKLLHLREAGIELTANGAMKPHASVCGLMIAHPASQYFAVGKIDAKQLEDYAGRRGTTAVELARFLAKNIG
ncbi:MAG: 5-methyltetrahydrofolate--homocysteine methyltransferase, partial [Bacteroidaceae bacterium]|nr:5-methyltetrahydrofolate--homocysteine methyltransferase [Bacteroidaceae bacterium]